MIAPSACGRSRSRATGARIAARVVLGLDQQRVALAAAGADRREAEPAAVAPQLVHHRADDSAPGGADRMPERDRAAVHVYDLLVRTEQPGRIEGDRGEGLVDLDPLDVVDRL